MYITFWLDFSVLKSFEQKLNVTEEKIISERKQNQLFRNEKKNKNKSDQANNQQNTV